VQHGNSRSFRADSTHTVTIPKSVDKPDSVSPKAACCPWAAIIYLRRQLLAASSGLPEALTALATPCSRGNSPLFSLAPDGGYLAACVTTNAGGLLHHLFTITGPTWQPAVCFSVALFRRVTPPGRYPASCHMEPGLSSPCYRARPPDRLGHHIHVSRPQHDCQATALLIIAQALRSFTNGLNRCTIWFDMLALEELTIG